MAAVRSLEHYLDLPYPIALTRGEGDLPWIAVVDELPGCEARGHTPAEAAARVQEAMEDWISAALAEGKSIPEPRPELSGKLLVRMPRTLHADLARAAGREQVSLNQFITGVLSAAVAWRRDGSGPPRAEAEAAAAPPPPARGLRPLLLANLVLVAVAAIVAVVLLITAT